MKILTILIISLATFILGYSVAEYTETPARTYIVQADKAAITRKKSKINIVIKNTGQPVQYISSEKPSENVKSIPLDAFLNQVDQLNTIQKKQNVIKIVYQDKTNEVVSFYALPTAIKFDKESNLLSIQSEKYINTKGSGEALFMKTSKLKSEDTAKDITIIFPY